MTGELGRRAKPAVNLPGRGVRLAFAKLCLAVGPKEAQQVVGMFLFHGKDLLDQRPGGGVGIALPTGDLGVYLDCDSFRHEILPKQIDK